jgi:hypothetical protein
MSVVAECLSHLRLREPQVHRNLSLFPLLGEARERPRVPAAGGALARGLVWRLMPLHWAARFSLEPGVHAPPVLPHLVPAEGVRGRGATVVTTPREEEGVVAGELPKRLQRREGLGREGHDVRRPHLHPVGRDAPLGGFGVELLPLRGS